MKTKPILVMLMIAALFTGISLFVSAQSDSGTLSSRAPFPRFHGEGTKDDPFLICSCDDLQLMSSLINCGEIYYPMELYRQNTYEPEDALHYADACYRLNGDIDCRHRGEAGYVSAIGRAGCPFTGEFDGAGFAITNVKLGGTTGLTIDNAYAGLFGYAVNASIHDLGIENAVVDANAIGTEIDVGALCGCFENDGKVSDAAVERCYVSDVTITVTAPDEYLIEEGFKCADVYCGGLIGAVKTSVNNKSANVRDCYAAAVNADASGKNVYVGGLVGYAGKNASAIEHCYAVGSVKASTKYKRTAQAGGIVAKTDQIGGGWSPWLASSYSVENCFADVAVSAVSANTAEVYLGTVCGRCLGDSETSNVYSVRSSISSKQDQHVDGKVVTADKAKTLSFWRDTLGFDMTDDWYLSEDGCPVLRTKAGLSVSAVTEDDGSLTVTAGVLSGLDLCEGRLIAVLYEYDYETAFTALNPFPVLRMKDMQTENCVMLGDYTRDEYTFTFDEVPEYGYVKVFFLTKNGAKVLSASAEALYF